MAVAHVSTGEWRRLLWYWLERQDQVTSCAAFGRVFPPCTAGSSQGMVYHAGRLSLLGVVDAQPACGEASARPGPVASAGPP